MTTTEAQRHRQKPHRTLLLWGLFTCLCVSAVIKGQALTPSDPQKMWAVVIGISHYQDFAQLRFAATDAKSIAEFLTSPRGGGIPADHIVTLYEGEATRAAVITELKSL